MIQRIRMLPGISQSMANRIVAGTFHSIFLKFLRSNGYNQKILANEKYKEIMIKNILRRQGLLDSYEPETILSLISYYKSSMIYPGQLKAKTPVEKEIKNIYSQFEKDKEKANYIDFDDILTESFHLLENNDVLRNQLQERFRYICIDEYQDCNRVQKELVQMLVHPKEQNLMVVGDAAQAIYLFRNASPKFILDFAQEYPHAKTVNLDTNYRSNTSIVGLGNALISHSNKPIGIQLNAKKSSDFSPLYMRPNDSDDEAKNIVDNIVSDVTNGTHKYGDFAILYRMHSLSRAVWDELVLRDIPFVVHGVSQVFYLNSIVKPVLDHLRLALDHNNIEAIAGIAPSLYLNKEKVTDHITNLAFTQEKKDYLALLLRMPNLKPYHQGQILNRIENIRLLKKMPPKKAIQFIRKGSIGYNKFLEMDERKCYTIQKELIDEILDELESASSKFQTVQEFIRFVDLIIQKHKEMEELKKNPHADAVQLLTLHAAKGLEFKCVYLIGFCEGIIPHKSIENANEQKDRIKLDQVNMQIEALEEERRLAYVGVTRAEEELYISSPKKYRGKDAEVSRFLLESFI